MTTVATMLDADPARSPMDTRLHADTVEALREAARVTRQCAHACLSHEGAAMRRCISLDLDVADLTDATAAMVIRLESPTATLAALAACRAALAACAEECQQHSHLRHCAICAEVCLRVEDQCLRAEAAVGQLSVVDGQVRRIRAATPGGGAPELPDGLPDELPAELDITSSKRGEQPIHLSAGGEIGDGAD